MPTLRIEINRADPQFCELSKDEFVIGRHPDCDLVIPDEMISRRHARIFRRPDGVYAEDLGSRNGTYVNSQRLNKAVKLRASDRISIEDLVITYLDGIGGGAAETSGAARETADHEHVFSLIEQRHLLRETVTGQPILSVDAADRMADPSVTLQAILDITRNLGSTLEVEILLQRILDSVFRAFPQAERGFILERDENSGELLLSAAKQRGRNGDASMTIGPISRSIGREVLSSGTAVLSAEGFAPNHELDDSVHDDDERSILCAPLIGPSRQSLGVIYVEAGSPGRPFVANDLDVLSCVAVLAGQAVEHARLYSDRYRAVVDTAVDGIVTINERGRIESVNPATERLFGYSRKELIGESVNILMPPDEQGQHDDYIARYLRTGEARLMGSGRDVVARRKDGSTFPIYLSLGEFRLDGRQFFTGIVHDNTAQKRAEEALKRLNESLEQRVQERTGYVRLLQDVAVIANEAETVDEALCTAMRRICRHLGWPIAHAWLPDPAQPDSFIDTGLWHGEESEQLDRMQEASRNLQFHPGEQIVGSVCQTGEAAWVVDIRQNREIVRQPEFERLGIESAVVLPVLVGPQVCAVLEFLLTERATLDNELLQVLANVGTQLGRVVERQRLQQQLVDVVWEQQRRFGQDLHDSLGQELTGIRMLADSLRRKLRARNVPESDAMEELSELIHETQQNVRRLSKGLFPVEVFEEGLMAALEELAESVSRQSGVECVFVCNVPVEIHGHETATHLFRIAQEATNNAVKHSRATRIEISLKTDGSSAELSVVDNGVGCPDAAGRSASGMGMRTMRYRANAIGGRLSIRSGRRKGTIVSCQVQHKRGKVAQP